MALYRSTDIAGDDSNGNAGGIRVPAIGEYDLNPRGVKVGNVLLVAGDDTGNVTSGIIDDTSPAATSDTDADIIIDSAQTQLGLFNVEGDSDAPDVGVWVLDVVGVVVTAWAGLSAYTLGDTDDVNGWGDDTLSAAVTSTNQGDSVAMTNFDTAGDYAFRLAGGKHYATSSGTIEAAITGDATAGRMAFFCTYFRTDKSGGG